MMKKYNLFLFHTLYFQVENFPIHFLTETLYVLIWQQPKYKYIFVTDNV